MNEDYFRKNIAPENNLAYIACNQEHEAEDILASPILKRRAIEAGLREVLALLRDLPKYQSDSLMDRVMKAYQEEILWLLSEWDVLAAESPCVPR